MKDFHVIYRDAGHWDILSNGIRMFKIRGDRGSYTVLNQVDEYTTDRNFNTVNACMNYICDLLMYET